MKIELKLSGKSRQQRKLNQALEMKINDHAHDENIKTHQETMDALLNDKHAIQKELKRTKLRMIHQIA